MKLQSKIEIDFLTFFKSGKFDYIKLGQTKEWILNNFPDPDDFGIGNSISNAKIWRYGTIEFHFDESHKLFLIYSDYIKDLAGGDNIELDKWILGNYSKLRLSYVLKELNKAKIDYCKTSDSLGIKLKLKSGVELGFLETYDEEIKDPNHLHLSYFSFMS